MQSTDAVQFDTDNAELICRGNWTLQQFPSLKSSLASLSLPSSGSLTINGENIESLDSSGAWLLNEWAEQQQQRGLTIQSRGFSQPHLQLLNLIEKDLAEPNAPSPPAKLNLLAKFGKTALAMQAEFITYLSFVGQLTIEAFRILGSPKHLRFKAFANVIYRNGYQALPIIALLSAMIGVVITYQMGLQLKNYGANVYIVDFLGLSVLREFGPLLTSIMVAGRTGSAFTAQLGIMKINQEIDALDTMGVTPAELLLLPRVVGLVIALPLLTVWSDIFGIFGGMVTASNMLNITWYDFLHRFPRVIPLRALLIGVGKAPIFALIIASIGCYEGMRVQGSADSVGRNTTRSVVLAIFFIIVADAAFSVIFSELKL